jgi:hypothetical protein
VLSTSIQPGQARSTFRKVENDDVSVEEKFHVLETAAFSVRVVPGITVSVLRGRRT